jgi:hypothetical protein
LSSCLAGAAAPPAPAVLPVRPSNGREPPAPTGPLAPVLPPPPALGAAPPPPPLAPPRGDLGRLQSKHVRRRAKLGANPQALQTQSPGWAGRAGPAPRPLPLGRSPPTWAPWGPGCRPRAPGCTPREPPPRDLSLLPRLESDASSFASSSRNPWRMEKPPSSPLPLPPPPRPPRCCGMAATELPPPPWCAAKRRRAASSATSARAVCRRRRCRLCQACSPRAVAASKAGQSRPRPAAATEGECGAPRTRGDTPTGRRPAAARRDAQRRRGRAAAGDGDGGRARAARRRAAGDEGLRRAGGAPS